MRSPSARPPSADELAAAIERFLESSRQPALFEDGESPIALGPSNMALTRQNGRLILQAWDERRSVTRRVAGVASNTAGRLVLRIERFGSGPAELPLVDLSRAAHQSWHRRSGRMEYREQFRRCLRRQFPHHQLEELTTGADLERSFSPVYPRAVLRQGASAWAAIGGPPNAMSVDDVLTFGLIWLDHLRQTEAALTVHGLVLFVPEGREKTTTLRLPCLDPHIARYRLFAYSADGERAVDLADCGNLDTHLDPCSQSRFETKHGTSASNSANNRIRPWSLGNRELWLESQVRQQIESIDAQLSPAPVYGQVPAFAATDRGIIDLLAADRNGRLAVLELKASEDIHLPLQALDYWIRVKWHLDRDEFPANGYFPGTSLRKDPPRLMLVAPALDFHSTNDCVLRYFAPEIEVERIGVGAGWRESIQVMFRRKR